ncbi:MAG: hypothetical protein LBB49_03095 [Gracilibacteraceae bacterium]|nr:hypothetical protein [Gracilibacteraceae bacterium]
MEIVLVLWYIIYFVQTFLMYGTAYRLTKRGGDNGVALFGWLFLLSLVAMIPGLGIYLWFRFRHEAPIVKEETVRFHDDQGDTKGDIKEQIDLGNLQEAEKMLDRSRGSNAERMYLRGLLFQKKGWYDDALSKMQKAVAMEPDNQEFAEALEQLRKDT